MPEPDEFFETEDGFQIPDIFGIGGGTPRKKKPNDDLNNPTRVREPVSFEADDGFIITDVFGLGDSDHRDLLEFDPVERSLATHVSNGIRNKAEPVLEAVERGMPGRPTHKTVDRMVRQAKRGLRNAHRDTKDGIRQALFDAAGAGGDKFSGSTGTLAGIDDIGEMVDHFGEGMEYYLDNYVERIIEPRLRKIQDTVKDPLLRRQKLQEAMDKALRESDNYWRIVSNTHVGRSYHYGYLEAADRQGFQKLMYMAIRDPRTTTFCTSIDGKTMSLPKVLRKAKKAARQSRLGNAGYAPWKTINSTRVFSEKNLLRKGLILPPFHAHCRTTIHAF